MNNITAQSFLLYMEARLKALPKNSVIKSIGTNQNSFIVVAEDMNGKEYKLYIPCEE